MNLRPSRFRGRGVKAARHDHVVVGADDGTRRLRMRSWRSRSHARRLRAGAQDRSPIAIISSTPNTLQADAIEEEARVHRRSTAHDPRIIVASPSQTARRFVQRLGMFSEGRHRSMLDDSPLCLVAATRGGRARPFLVRSNYPQTLTLLLCASTPTTLAVLRPCWNLHQ